MRTQRRSRAEIKFVEGSKIRLNERTTLLIESSERLRKYQLSSGALWVKVASGVATQVETPTATAAARGTEYATWLDGFTMVLEGEVALQAKGKAVTIPAGNFGRINSEGEPEGPFPISGPSTPLSLGGSTPQFWETFESDVFVRTLAGTSHFDELSKSPALEGAGGVGTGRPSGNGDLGIVVSSREVKPLRPSLVEDSSSVLDRPEYTLGESLAGLGLFLTDRPTTMDHWAWSGKGVAFGQIGEPTVYGSRFSWGAGNSSSILKGTFDFVRYERSPEIDLAFRPVMEGYGERTVAPGVKLFAGRKSIAAGPVILDSQKVKLLSARHSSIGARFKTGGTSLEAGWLSDSDWVKPGAQRGGYASLTTNVLEGQVGLSALYGKDSNKEFGWGANLALPIGDTGIDFYGEVNRGLENDNYAYIGGFLAPVQLGRFDLDLIFEASYRRDLGAAYSFAAVCGLTERLEAYARIGSMDGARSAAVGFAWKF